MYIASNGIKTAVILNDDHAYSPRNPDYVDNLGTMVCWHRRHNLGDEHDYSNPSEFLLDMAEKYIDLKALFQFVQEGRSSSLRLQAAGDHYDIQVNEADRGEPAKWETLETEISKDLELMPGHGEDVAREVLFLSMPNSDIIMLLAESNNVAIKPVFLYDHSGLSVSTGSFIGRAQHAEWDSSQVGYIYLDKETAMKEMSMAGDKLTIAKAFYSYDRTTFNFERPAGKDVDQVLKEDGFQPVRREDIKNLYDPNLSDTPNQPVIDPNQLDKGLVFKKDHRLYEFLSYEPDGSFNMDCIASYNPDLIPLTEETWKARAEECLEGEVTDYDNYLQGEVYGYQLYEGAEEVKSVWGFNPGKEDIKDVMMEELSSWFGPGLNFEYSSDPDFDIDIFLMDQDFPELKERITKNVATLLYEDFQMQIPFPYAMSFDDIRGNKDGVLDAIVKDLYELHEEPTTDLIRETICEHAGISRSVQPKITIEDLEPGRDYTAEELMGIISKKPSLNDIIAGAAARQASQDMDHDSMDHGPER